MNTYPTNFILLSRTPWKELNFWVLNRKKGANVDWDIYTQWNMGIKWRISWFHQYEMSMHFVFWRSKLRSYSASWGVHFKNDSYFMLFHNKLSFNFLVYTMQFHVNFNNIVSKFSWTSLSFHQEIWWTFFSTCIVEAVSGMTLWVLLKFSRCPLIRYAFLTKKRGF